MKYLFTIYIVKDYSKTSLIAYGKINWETNRFSSCMRYNRGQQSIRVRAVGVFKGLGVDAFKVFNSIRSRLI